MNEWNDEWRTAPYDPLPSNINPLHLLFEPTWVHLDAHTHAQKVKDVLLVHYCPDMVPEARAHQDLEMEQEQRRYFEEDTEDVIQRAQKALSRAAVVRAARRTNVDLIDMTEDGTSHRDARRRIQGDFDTRQKLCTQNHNQ